MNSSREPNRGRGAKATTCSSRYAFTIMCFRLRAIVCPRRYGHRIDRIHTFLYNALPLPYLSKLGVQLEYLRTQIPCEEGTSLLHTYPSTLYLLLQLRTVLPYLYLRKVRVVSHATLSYLREQRASIPSSAHTEGASGDWIPSRRGHDRIKNTLQIPMKTRPLSSPVYASGD